MLNSCYNFGNYSARYRVLNMKVATGTNQLIKNNLYIIETSVFRISIIGDMICTLYFTSLYIFPQNLIKPFYPRAVTIANNSTIFMKPRRRS